MSDHFPVLLDEVIETLITDIDGVYVDCTLGFAGHSSSILKKISKHGFLIGLDLDPYALNKAEKKLKETGKEQFSVHHASYKQFPEVLSKLGIDKVSGFLFDLGISSYQIDSEHRGFSYMREGPLDMRFNPQGEKTAKDVLSEISEKELIEILQTYAEISHADKIAKSIIHERNKNNMNTTSDLKIAISNATNGICSNKILSRIFQALRITVNDEIQTFKDTLSKIPNYLVKGGRVCVISFHSIEDRIAKHFFKDSVIINEYDYYDRSKLDSSKKLNVLTKKPIVATRDEVFKNTRSRSAKLRVAQL